jgi:hypothetical protein
MAASVLIFESLVVAFAIAVAVQVSDVRPAVAVTVGLTLSALCVVVSGLLRTRLGYVLGSVLQVLVLATGFVVPAMFLMGGIFAALWVTALLLGRRIVEVERAREAEQHGAEGPAAAS